MNLQEIYEPITEELIQVEVELKKQITLMCKENEYSNNVMQYFFNVPGKKLRPALVLLSAGSVKSHVSVVNYNLIYLAVAMELIHSASLIHDDIIDGSKYRRGQLTLNRYSDDRIAVLAGDLFYTRAFTLLMNILDKKVLNTVSLCIENMCYGEICEVNKSGVLFDEYLKIIKYKTANFMSICCLSASYLLDTDESNRKALEKYGLNLGVTYQLVDDYKDKDSSNSNSSILEAANKFSSKAINSLKTLDDSVYKERLEDLVNYFMMFNRKEMVASNK
jgi:octaprenyl-diphosphate synthase